MQENNPGKLLSRKPSYSYRNVLTLKELHQWSSEEKEEHLRENRVLQNAFAVRDKKQVLNDALLVGESWLTDIVCPNPSAALIMHLGKKMVVDYRINEDEIGIKAQQAYEKFGSMHSIVIDDLQHTIDDEFVDYCDSKTKESLREEAIERIKKNYKKLNKAGEEITEDKIQAAERILLDLKRRDITNKVVTRYLDSPNALGVYSALKLEKKPEYRPGQNHDYVFQGGAGSGKSTISKNFLTLEDKKDSITLATDNYRAIAMPGEHVDESKRDTKNIFCRTQDMAYMVKELVHEELGKKHKSGSRPNVICDCIAPDNFMKNIIKNSKITSIVAAYSGDSGIGIAERAEHRALNDQASPSDKGRYVNTKSLLEGHANASDRLFTLVTQDAQTLIYNTDVERGEEPPKIAEIFPKEKELKVYNLNHTSRFLNKKNLNIDAENPIELACSKDGFSSRPEKKAESLLAAALPAKRKAAYKISLFNEEGQPEYATISYNGNKYELEIKDNERFKQIAFDESSINGLVLRSITRQVVYGSREASEKVKAETQCAREKEDIETFKTAYNELKAVKAAKEIGKSLQNHKAAKTTSKNSNKGIKWDSKFRNFFKGKGNKALG